MTKMKPMHLSAVFWGDWHRDAFLQLNLPSLLSARNLPAISEAGHDITFDIFTTIADNAILDQSPIFNRLRDFADVKLHLFDIPPSGNPMALHHDFWNQSVEFARKKGAFILMIPPDVIWNDGAFSCFAEDISSGKQALFLGMPRITVDSLVPELRENNEIWPPVEPVSWQPRDLLHLVERHPHPLFFCYEEGSENFPIHPELLIWRVKDEGYVVRFLVRELFGFDTVAQSFESAHPIKIVEHSKYRIYTDSDEVCVLSLAPLLKDVEWYRHPRRMNDLAVATWWQNNDYAMNDRVSEFALRFKIKDPDTHAWAKVEEKSLDVVRRLRSARDFLALAHFMRAGDATNASNFLITGLSEFSFAKFFKYDKPCTILVPSDGVISEELTQIRMTKMLRAGGRSFRRLAAEYILTESFPPNRNIAARTTKTLAGTPVVVENSRSGGLSINGRSTTYFGVGPKGNPVYGINGLVRNLDAPE